MIQKTTCCWMTIPASSNAFFWRAPLICVTVRPLMASEMTWRSSAKFCTARASMLISCRDVKLEFQSQILRFLRTWSVHFDAFGPDDSNCDVKFPRVLKAWPAVLKISPTFWLLEPLMIWFELHFTFCGKLLLSFCSLQTKAKQNFAQLYGGRITHPLWITIYYKNKNSK